MTQTRTRQVDLTGPGAQVGAEWRRLVATPGQSVTVDRPPVRHHDGTVTMLLTVTEVVAAGWPASRPASKPARQVLVQLRRPVVYVPTAAGTGVAGYGLYRLGVAVWQACEAAWAWVTTHVAEIIGGIVFVLAIACLLAYAYKRVCEGAHFKH
jgi:hypothetical protein